MRIQDPYSKEKKKRKKAGKQASTKFPRKSRITYCFEGFHLASSFDVDLFVLLDGLIENFPFGGLAVTDELHSMFHLPSTINMATKKRRRTGKGEG